MKKVIATTALFLMGLQLMAQFTPLNTFFKMVRYKYWDQPPCFFNSNLQQVNDGGYLSCRMVIDSTGSAGYHYYDLIKYTIVGNPVWVKRILVGNASTYAMMAGVASLQSKDHGYLAAMVLHKSATASEAALIKLDTARNVQWAKKYPGEYASAPIRALQTADRGYLVCGYTKDTANVDQAYIFKTDSMGGYQWGRKCIVNGDTGAYFNAILELSGNGYIACGYSGRKAIIAKFDQNGNVIWGRSYFQKGSQFNSLSHLSDNSVLIGGSFQDTSSSYNARMCLLKMDTAGNLFWSKYYNLNPTPYYGSAALSLQRMNGAFAIGGYIMDPIPAILIAKLDLAGNLKWARTYTASHPFSNSDNVLIRTSDGGFAMDEFVGTFYHNAANFSKLLLKTDSDGVSGCDGNAHTLGFGNFNYPPQNNLTITNCGFAASASVIVSDLVETDSVYCQNITDPVGMPEMSRNSSIALYPNPANDLITLKNIQASDLFTIFDLYGRVVKEIVVSPETTQIDISDLSPGIYIIRSQGFRARFIKE